MNSPKPVDVISESWDYLIVLDACRYDYFERHWRDFLQEGQLSCRRSPGSCTSQWLSKSFPDYYEDIVYISANPHICSNQSVSGYCAGEHFFKVFEVWRNGWDRTFGTVLPEILTDTALEIIPNDVTRNKRVIIHYLQPHAPYIDLVAPGSDGSQVLDIRQKKVSMKGGASQQLLKVKRWAYRSCYEVLKRTTLFGNKPDWVLRKFFNLSPQVPMEFTLRNHNTEELKKAYEDNLKRALKEVTRLQRYLSGEIVITADHGEFLGEKKYFSHPLNCDHSIVRNVPWLKIARDKPICTLNRNTCENIISQDDGQQLSEEAVLERLRALGYHD